MSSEDLPKVLVYDNHYPEPEYEKKVRAGIAQTNWQPRVFNDIREAYEEFNDTFEALILSINGLGSASRNGQPLITVSDGLEIPRAVIVPVRAIKLIRPGSSDRLIPRDNLQAIPDEVASWLTKLATNDKGIKQ